MVDKVYEIGILRKKKKRSCWLLGMWMYSLGRALLDTTPRVAALTGTVSVSPSSALQSVLAAMTEPDPRRRASLMNLLDVSFIKITTIYN
ncbi:hypothetical protein M0802_015653 [Mischocyttarus mexicanus]|nr:hypothetical protein M0802_015653 [Mischocyttarus mexicanus]